MRIDEVKEHITHGRVVMFTVISSHPGERMEVLFKVCVLKVQCKTFRRIKGQKLNFVREC